MLYNRHPKRHLINTTRLVPAGVGGIYDSTDGLVTLPQNLMLQPDVPLEGFEAASEWTADTGSVADNAVQCKVGTQSIKLTTADGATGSMTKTISMVDLNNYEFFGFWFYLHDTDRTHYTSIKFYISSTADFSKSFNFTIDPPLTNIASWPVQSNWMLYRIPLYLMTNTGGESWSNIMIRVRFVVASASGVVDVSFDDLVGGYKRIPAILFRHDDGYISLYNNGAFQHMKLLGLRGDLHISPEQIRSSGGTTVLSIAMIQEMYRAGWCISNHGDYGHHVTAGGMGDYSAVEQEYIVGSGQKYISLTANCPGGERYFSYNGGGTYYENGNTATALVNAGAIMANGSYGAATGFNIAGARAAYMPFGSIYNVEMYPANGQGLANWKAAYDLCKAHGQFLVINLDQLDGGAGTTADYNALMDYIISDIRSGQVVNLTFDELYRLTLGSITINTPPVQVASSWTLPALPVSIDFESGTVASNVDSVVDADANLSLTAGSAMNGTTKGLNVHFAGGTDTDRYVRGHFALYTETDICLRFFFDFNSSTIAGTMNILKILQARTNYRAAAIYISYSAPNVRLTLGAAPDSGTVSWGTAFTITDAPHMIEVVLHRATTDGGTDGWAKIYVDGTLKDTKSTIANYNLFLLADRVQIGGQSVNVGIAGDMFFDEIKMNRTGVLIGA